MNPNISLSRVTDGMRFNGNNQNLMDIISDLRKKELELTTGKKVNAPSDDPLAATRILNLSTSLNRIEQYERNLSVSKSRLSHLDTVLSDLNDITNRARTILMAQVGDTGNAQTRSNAALEVTNMLNEAMDLANRMFDNRYIFGGSKTDTAPFEAIGTYVAFQGTSDEWLVPMGVNSFFASSLNSESVLGARSAEITGRNDLTPALNLSTRLADLNGGTGVRLDKVLLSDGTDSVTIDLSGAVDLQDIADRFNATGLVTASLKPDSLGLRLSSPGNNISVTEVDQGHTAADLGILSSNSGATLDGGNLNAILRESTLISDIRDGSGLDLSGFTIQNGNINTTIDLSGITTVGDLFTRVNSSGAYIEAEINSTKDGINFVSLLNGAEFTLTEAGGTSAAELGLEIPTGELPISSLNKGFGISTNFGPDFMITLHDGTSFSVDVSNADTLEDIVDSINTASGNNGNLTAGYGTGKSLSLTDSTAGSSQLSVTPIKGSRAALYLGIENSTANATLDGEQLNPAGVRINGLFNSLIALRDSLASNDQNTLSLVGEGLDTAQNMLLDSRADVGGRINRLELAENRFAEQKISLNDALSQERDVDFAEATIAYQQQQVRLQAALNVIGMISSQSLLDFLR